MSNKWTEIEKRKKANFLWKITKVLDKNSNKMKTKQTTKNKNSFLTIFKKTNKYLNDYNCLSKESKKKTYRRKRT